jgi:PKHD-type hydroxylase
MFTNYYWLWNEVIPKEVCDLIVKNAPWNTAVAGSVFDADQAVIDKTKRITDIVWADQLSAAGCIAQSYIKYANNAGWWNFDITDMEMVQLGRYEEGGHYDWHTDTATPFNGVQRKLSFTLLLNDPSEFEGGAFEIKNAKDQPNLKQGSIIVFPSLLEHRVTPVTSGVRYSAVAWATGPSFK